MKSLLLFFALTSSGPLLARQQAPDSLFVVTYTTGSTWSTTKSPGEQPYFKEHSAHLSQLRKNGVIKMGARYGDKGIIVIAAASLLKAKELIEADQAIQNKLFTAEVQKFNVFYEGCVERPN